MLMVLFETDVRLSRINTSLYKLAELPFGAGVCLPGLLLTTHKLDLLLIHNLLLQLHNSHTTYYNSSSLGFLVFYM